MNIRHIDTIPFKYKSILKTEWLKGNMPSVTNGIYGGKLTQKNVTLEHIQPHSKGGKTELKNLALAVDVNNFQRSSKPLSTCLTRDMFETYCKQFEEVKLPDFDGKKYVIDLAKTVDRLLNQSGKKIKKGGV